MKITKTKKGYTTVVNLGKDATGKQIIKRFSAETKTDLLRDVADFKASTYRGTESRIFADCLDRYITAREPHRSPSGIKGYKSIQRTFLRLYGDAGRLSVDSMTDHSVQLIVNDLQKRNYSLKTIKNWIGLINSVLIEEGVKPARVIISQQKPQERDIPTSGEIKMLLCLMHGHRLEVPFKLALLGLRRGEICALTIQDLSKDNVLHIHRSKVLVDGGGFVVRDTAKNDTSNRFIQIPKDLADLIRRQGYVTDYGLNALSDAYQDFLVKYRFPKYRLHDCRHFYASYCHSLGIPEADILAGGGWKTSGIMKSVYRHSMAKNRASAAIGQLLGSSSNL